MDLPCWDMFLLYKFWWEFLSSVDVKFCQMLFIFYWYDHVTLTFILWMWSITSIYRYWGFPGSSESKESACNEGDPGSVPGLGRSSVANITDEYRWKHSQKNISKPNSMAKLVSHILSLEFSRQWYWRSILACRFPRTDNGVAKNQIWLSDFHFIDTEPSLQVGNKFHLIAMYDPIYILLNLE